MPDMMILTDRDILEIDRCHRAKLVRALRVRAAQQPRDRIGRFTRYGNHALPQASEPSAWCALLGAVVFGFCPVIIAIVSACSTVSGVTAETGACEVPVTVCVDDATQPGGDRCDLYCE